MMQLKRFDRIDEFYPLVEPFLLAHEAEHCLMLGLSTNLLKHDSSYQEQPYLAFVEDGGEIVAVALRTPPYNLILSYMTDDKPLSVIADDVQSLYSELRGVLGMQPYSQIFAERWKAMSGQQYRLNLHEGIYRLECVKPVSDVRGTYRLAYESDREILTQWFIEFSAEAVEPISHEEAERLVTMRLTSEPSLRGVRLWVVDGVPVSFAGYSGPTPNGIRIGPVYTPPNYRGHGYASACVAALSQEMLDAGRKFVFLFTDLSNPTSNHIYQTIGYEMVSTIDEYRFERQA
jgi:uncharacterized protein